MKKYLISGLGNIGESYAGTRHNIGFTILDTLAEEDGFVFEPEKLGSLARFRLKGRLILYLKPSTFMNRSGKAVKYWMEKEKIPAENLLVITDDINLPFGTLRLKTRGSDGGHNGLRDIQEILQTAAYNRLRFGLGSDFRKGGQSDYVLGKWGPEEQKALPERLQRAAAFVRAFVLSGVTEAMNEFNNT